ncbi:hypothetical protein KDA08_04910, partial [Candidatus Saccharibacteria bacterium]|nr:hypothetical protein [Candidatus Saccharibacteria bacterium]
MSEFITQQTLERDVNNALDKVLPYEPYERTASDIVLVEEAELLADTRIKHLYEIFDEEGTRGTLRRSVRADAFYDEHYSGIDWREDANLLGLTMFKLSGTQILCKYGSDEVRNDIGLQFANKYSYSANKTILNCVHHRFAIRQAEDYLKAAYDFTEELHLLDHLGEDHMLLEPFVKLGTSLADVFLEPGSG